MNIEIPKGQWVKIASNTLGGSVRITSTDPGRYYYDITTVGGAAPTDFETATVVALRSFSRVFDEAVDIYMYAYGFSGSVEYNDGAGAITPVKNIESDNPSIEHYLYEELNAVSFAVAPSRGDYELSLNSGHGFVNPVGSDFDYLNIHYADPGDSSFVGTRFSQHTVTSVVGDLIEVTPPIAYDVTIAYIENMQRVNVNMAVVGTRAAPAKFVTTPPDGQSWELRRFMPSMILTTQGDDGLFGNLSPLANGQYFGFENALFAEYQLTIFENSGWANSAYDIRYPVRSGGGGSAGMNVRKTVAGQDKSNVVIKLYGETDDQFVSYIQDDITGIVLYRIKVMGNVAKTGD